MAFAQQPLTQNTYTTPHREVTITCIPGLFATMGGIAISNDSGAIKCQTGDGRGLDMGGKEKWEQEEGESEKEKQESVHLHGWHETKFLTNSCMFAYE